jgi:hypothetical protein
VPVRDRARACSQRFQPPFAMIDPPGDGCRGQYAPLGIGYEGAGQAVLLAPVAGEDVLARFSVVCEVAGAMNAKGEPPAVGSPDETYSIVRLARGVGELAVTNVRLVILLTRGESIVGRVSMPRGAILAVTMRLDEIESVGVRTSTGLLRRRTERVAIERLSHGATIRIEQGIEITEGRVEPSPAGIGERVTHLVVEAAARARLRSPYLGDDERDILERALRGERAVMNGETVARLAP